MKTLLRKLWPSLAALAVTAVSLVLLPFSAALAAVAVVCLVAVVRFKKPLWRNSAVTVAACLLGLAGIEFGLSVLEPRGEEIGAVREQTPQQWYPSDPIVQFRPLPNTKVRARSTWHGQLLYDVTYTILPSGDRAVPGSVDRGPTYLFFGDSYAFASGVNDADTAASQFARQLRPAGHVVNLGVPGWGATHMVRAVEAGLVDKYVVGKVAAVIVWVTPPHLERVTGDASWLENAPRYDYGSDGKLHFSSTFKEYRWAHPLDGLAYLARAHLRIVQRLTNESQERKQVQLYIDLIGRLRELVHERYGAPLILLSNGPEESPPDQPDLQYLPAFDGLRAIGAPVISVRKLLGPPAGWDKYFIPHDGHPTVLLNRIVANTLISYFAQRPD